MKQTQLDAEICDFIRDFDNLAPITRERKIRKLLAEIKTKLDNYGNQIDKITSQLKTLDKLADSVILSDKKHKSK